MDLEKDKKWSIKQLCLIVLICMGVLLFIVFIILPAIFVLVGYVYPAQFSSDGALTALMSGVNSAIGYCSLGVGVVSIVYAFASNRRVDEQQRRNEEFLKELSNKIDELQKSNLKLFDQVVNTQQNNTKQDNSK